MSAPRRFSGYTTETLMEQIARLDQVVRRCDAYGVTTIAELRQMLVDLLEERAERERRQLRREDDR